MKEINISEEDEYRWRRWLWVKEMSVDKEIGVDERNECELRRWREKCEDINRKSER